MAVSMDEKKTKTAEALCSAIAIYERDFRKWQDKSKKIIKRYKDERNNSENTIARFNILWSNVQTLMPALYAKNPVPNVDRRFEDDDKVGTTAARVLERSVTYFVDSDLFGNCMSQVVLDRLLPGRGVAWVRYVPNFKDKNLQGLQEVRQEGAQATDDIVMGDESTPELYSEDVVLDYVHWMDFGHAWGRTWEEVPMVWRKVYLSRDDLKERFGEELARQVPLDKEEKENGEKVGADKACIYEIWDKVKKKAYWLHKSLPDVLDERDDPLGLKDFFPCPKPVYATVTNENLIPSPDYTQYQDQAIELDALTGRITSITKALKVVGVYDSSAEGVSRILSEGLENQMVPVEQWAIFGEKGGLKGVVDWFPMEMVVNTLIQLYAARDKVKQDLYEISGISDIIRGASNPNETATAQQIKGQFATLRLDNMQKDVARFSRDLVRIMAEIISEHFSIDTIKQISGIKLLTQAEKMQLQMMAQTPGQPGPDGQPTPPKPLTDEQQEMLDNPTWEEIEALLRDDTLRCFRISIETDSTIKTDQENEKKSRIELIGAVSGFLQQSATLPPQLQPLAAELLMFGVRGFKISREIDTTFDIAMKKIKEAAEAPPQPDPQIAMEQQKMQLEAEKLRAESQYKQGDLQLKAQDLQLKSKDFDLREKELQANTGIEHAKIQSDVIKAKFDAKTKLSPDVVMSDPEMNDGNQMTPMAQVMESFANMMMQGFQQLAAQQQQGNQAIIQAITAPKTTSFIRDDEGRIAAGVSKIQ